MSSEPHATASDLARCRRMLREGSKSFAAASLLLPSRVRHPATIVYAFCRHADDEIDLHGGHDAVVRLRYRLDAIYEDNPGPHSVDRALADMVHKHQIPKAAFEALLEGFEWDLAERRYETIEDVIAYGVRVAGTVGVIMAVLMGVRKVELLARACDLGIAMQLTNIARDVGEDAAAGRLYLPRQWFADEGLEPDTWLASPTMSPDIARITERLLNVAESFYRRAEAGIAALPRDCRPGIYAARLIYGGIGKAVARNRFNSVDQRAYLNSWQKLRLLLRSFFPPQTRAGLQEDTQPEARFLLENAELEEGSGPSAEEERLAVLFGIIAKLNERDRQRVFN